MSEFYPIFSTRSEQLLAYPVSDHMSDEMVLAMRAMTITEKLYLVEKINREVRRRVAESNGVDSGLRGSDHHESGPVRRHAIQTE